MLATGGDVGRLLRARGPLLPSAGDAQPGTHPVLLLGDRRIQPSLADGNRLEFLVPPWHGVVHIEGHADGTSRAPRRGADGRYLGFAVSRIRVRGPTQSADIALDSPALDAGWGPIETQEGLSFRWTDGHAALTLPAATRHGAILELTLCPPPPGPTGRT